MQERTWEISDIDGSNKRTVTLAQYLAEVAAASKKAQAIHARNVNVVARDAAYTPIIREGIRT